MENTELLDLVTVGIAIAILLGVGLLTFSIAVTKKTK